MSDLDKLKDLLKSFGVEFTVNPRNLLLDYYKTDTDIQDAVIITVEQEDCNGIGGYDGFYTNFEFDKDGKFISMGAWE